VVTDPDAPAVVITWPPGDYETTGPCIDVQGTVTDDSTITVFTVNGNNVSIPGGTFDTEVCGLESGENIIEIHTCDEHGNCATIQRTVILINSPPDVDAGDNLQIPSAEQAFTIVTGVASDVDNDLLQYRWLEVWEENGEIFEMVLTDWADVSPFGEADLDLGLLPYLETGNHALVVEVTDGQFTVSDEMILTVQNSPPEVQPAPVHQVVEVGVDPITISATVSDFDGDTLTYAWLMNDEVLDSGVVAAIQGGDPVTIADLGIDAGDPRFPVGLHDLSLEVSDGVNDPVFQPVTVEVQDTTAPTLSPSPSDSMLWPPNHLLHDITIQANAFDNGGPVNLEVEVLSSEPVDDNGDGSTDPDWYVDAVDDVTGVIQLRLRAERQGRGPGRTYTVVITATDASGNETVSMVDIRAPHDKRSQ
jgi:hypothetical protein